MIRDKIIKYKGIILFIIGSMLIFIALFLSFYSRIDLIRESLFSEMEILMINNGEFECNCNNEISDENDEDLSVETDYVEENSEIEKKSQNNNSIKKEYIGYLTIPKISLKYGFVAKNSYYNNVDRNIAIIDPSNFPDVSGGNFIIAGHSGSASVAFFRNLYLLKLGDITKINYNGKTYTYKIVDIYKDKKDGTISIRRDRTKTTLTLITCSYKDKQHQTVYISELQSVF